MMVVKTEPLPVECVVRGYLAGSGWKDYQATGRCAASRCPPACASRTASTRRSSRPSTKAESGPRREHLLRARWSGLGARARRRAARREPRDLRARARPRRGARDHARRHQVRVRHRGRARWSGSTRRSRPTPRASGRATATSPAAPSPASTSSTCATTWRRWTGTSGRRPRPLPEDVVRRTREKYLEALRAPHRERSSRDARRLAHAGARAHAAGGGRSRPSPAEPRTGTQR